MFRRDYEYQLLGDVYTQRKYSRQRRNKLVLFFIALLIIIIMIITLYFTLAWKREYHFPASPSKLGKYKQAAVTCGATMCSEIGKSFLENKNASTVDAALATLICLDIGMPMSSGIGGGSFIMVYDIKTEKFTFINARETAPRLATKDMFNNKSSTRGPLSVAVPGQVYGLWHTHQKFGKIPWKDLFTPTINLAKNGYKVPYSLAQSLKGLNATIFKTPDLKRIYVNPSTGACYREGEILKRPQLAETLTKIANEGYLAFYNGSLSWDIVQDLKDASNDSIISLEDLATYKTVERIPLKVELNNGIIVHAPPPPSSGVLVQFILNILDNYGFKPKDLTDLDNLPLTVHRIVEAFKFAFAERSNLGDEGCYDENLLKNLTSYRYAKSIKDQISDKKTYGVQYYHPHFANKEDHGTAHLNILGPDGSAVSITTTLNYAFGSKVCGKRTDICFNNEMGDFSSPHATNNYGIPPSKSNFIEPGKRPMSSMSPIIMVDQKGDVVAVFGGAGGTKILTAVAYVAVNLLWLGNNAKQAVDALRIHDQLLPPLARLESVRFPQNVINKMKLMGYNVTEYGFKSKAHCIYREDNFVYANVDFRRGGDPVGF